LGVCNIYLIVTLLIRVPFLLQYLIENKRNADFMNSTFSDSRVHVIVTFMLLQIGFVASLYINSYNLLWAQLSSFNPLMSCVGVVLAAVHVLILFSVHRELGSSFSPSVSSQLEQRLKTQGPYRFARHPMYAVFFLRPMCVFLITQNWFYALCWLPSVLNSVYRVPREEALLVEQFGEEYVKYRERVGAFWPWKPFGLDFGLSDNECSRLLNSKKRAKKMD
jgi:protein-S-isoprenylcysteine O-methyltransferase Ste14